MRMDFKRLKEDEQFKIAQKWLTDNGKLSSSTYLIDEQSMIKLIFKDNNDNVFEQNCIDIIRGTILLYDEINN
jgi:hypothetical protein